MRPGRWAVGGGGGGSDVGSGCDTSKDDPPCSYWRIFMFSEKAFRKDRPTYYVEPNTEKIKVERLSGVYYVECCIHNRGKVFGFPSHNKTLCRNNAEVVICCKKTFF